jgi:hypothetical protein
MGNFAFFWFLRVNRPMLLNGFRSWLEQHTLPELKNMVDNNIVPPFQSDWVHNCVQFKSGISDITMKMWLEFITESSPELGAYITGKGEAGDQYLDILRQRFLYLLDHPDEADEQAAPASSSDPVVSLHCDKCDKSWPVRQNKVSEVIECPFCHARADAQ